MLHRLKLSHSGQHERELAGVLFVGSWVPASPDQFTAWLGCHETLRMGYTFSLAICRNQIAL